MNFLARAVRSAAVLRVGSVSCAHIGASSAVMSKSLLHTIARPPTVQKVFANKSAPKLFEVIQRDSSTLKKRRMMMNKHKRKKRKKLLRMNTKVSRG